MRQDVNATPTNVFNDSNYLNFNALDTNSRMYSRMGDLELFRNSIDGKFHLKLCYPHLTDYDNEIPCFDFRQTDNPFNVTNSTQSVQGLEVMVFDDMWRIPFEALDIFRL